MSDLILWYAWSSALTELEVFLYSLINKGLTCQKIISLYFTTQTSFLLVTYHFYIQIHF